MSCSEIAPEPAAKLNVRSPAAKSALIELFAVILPSVPVAWSVVSTTFAVRSTLPVRRIEPALAPPIVLRFAPILIDSAANVMFVLLLVSRADVMLIVSVPSSPSLS